MKQYLLILLLSGSSLTKSGIGQTNEESSQIGEMPNSQVNLDDEKSFNELTILIEEDLIDDVQLTHELEKLKERGKLNFEQRIELARLRDNIRLRRQLDARPQSNSLDDSDPMISPMLIMYGSWPDWPHSHTSSYLQEQPLRRQHEQQSSLQN